MSQTLFDKIWERHVVESIADGPDVLYIDRQLIHEVTSPQAFDAMRRRGLKVFRPQQVTATPDHNTPTLNQHLPIREEASRKAVEALRQNCRDNGIAIFDLNTDYNGVVHIVGPELGLTQPGMTIVCGDSHTATHGAFGCIAFGIGTSEVEMALATQCLLQSKPKQMRITLKGKLQRGVGAKDAILYLIAQLTASGGTGCFVEYAGEAFRSMSMEERMTVCNMSIEMGARGGLMAPDEATFRYVKGRMYAPQGAEWEEKLSCWKTLFTDSDASFDKEYIFDAEDIKPYITYGTNPGMGMGIDEAIPPDEPNVKALEYMGFKAGEKLLGKPVSYVFIGSCTNGRIEDFRAAAQIIRGRKKAANVFAYLVPGSKSVERQAREEGLAAIFEEAGFTFRQPGCSACLAMNEDKVPAGEYCASTSNRNFEGRQGAGARTLLVSPLTAAAAAVTGKITDPRELM
ncbi:MAG: 3-isopropylmalate dehydratase large subunit [Prevotellaceae bacterium]|jgi:3-isopropylmalate/(R)-2-methylmalate dehydratase large subunit|nr:3-isopropylmalate dehydratase large subunit [Prevotellaceae bacterium]